MNAIQKGKTLKHGSFFHQISRQKALHVSSEAKETRAMQTTVINTFIINFILKFCVPCTAHHHSKDWGQ